LISVKNDPDLDTIPPYQPAPAAYRSPRGRAPIELLAEFRRLRQATCSVLRSLPDDAWRRQGTSRLGYDVTIRGLAEGLAEHDYRYLRAMDQALDRSGAREGLATVQKAHLDELLRLVPETLKI
ncbi:MAG TPA: DinB family protein, partial [Thermomicrobiales bacterium]|nr:DinB family protein [Thermomicrobiales bacterium]